jgi:hypothetical protein
LFVCEIDDKDSEDEEEEDDDDDDCGDIEVGDIAFMPNVAATLTADKPELLKLIMLFKFKSDGTTIDVVAIAAAGTGGSDVTAFDMFIYIILKLIKV